MPLRRRLYSETRQGTDRARDVEKRCETASGSAPREASRGQLLPNVLAAELARKSLGVKGSRSWLRTRILALVLTSPSATHASALRSHHRQVSRPPQSCSVDTRWASSADSPGVRLGQRPASWACAASSSPRLRHPPFAASARGDLKPFGRRPAAEPPVRNASVHGGRKAAWRRLKVGIGRISGWELYVFCSPVEGLLTVEVVT